MILPLMGVLVKCLANENAIFQNPIDVTMTSTCLKILAKTRTIILQKQYKANVVGFGRGTYAQVVSLGRVMYT